MPLHPSSTSNRVTTQPPPRALTLLEDSTSSSSSSSNSPSLSWELLNTPTTHSPTPPQIPPSNEDTPFDTTAFPPHSHLFPHETNGTWHTETAHLLRHPHLIDWPALSTALQDVVVSAAERAGGALNRSCEGRDVAEMESRVVALVPGFGLPTGWRVERMVDVAGDTVQNFARRWWRGWR
ncbi:hypothetical protein J1614_005496 [Plenodomus biglobosus]|nr:hypothetical protein J1614_005496 [Plenodomus biglobosus]